MKYKVIKDTSLRESMRRYKENGDDRWVLFDALLRSSTYGAYMAKVRGFEQVIISKQTNKPWKITPSGHFGYEKRLVESRC